MVTSVRAHRLIPGIAAALAVLLIVFLSAGANAGGDNVVTQTARGSFVSTITKLKKAISSTGITGGLITSTLMTLVVIPVAYMLMDDAIALIKRIYLVERTPVVDATRVDAFVSSLVASDPGLTPALGTDSSSGEGSEQETTVRTGHDKADAAE